MKGSLQIHDIFAKIFCINHFWVIKFLKVDINLCTKGSREGGREKGEKGRKERQKDPSEKPKFPASDNFSFTFLPRLHQRRWLLGKT